MTLHFLQDHDLILTKNYEDEEDKEKQDILQVNLIQWEVNNDLLLGQYSGGSKTEHVLFSNGKDLFGF